VKNVGVLLVGMILAFYLGQVSSTQALKEVQKEANTVAKIKSKGSLGVVMINGPTTYFEGAISKEGFDYLLMQDFAESLDVKLKLYVVSTVSVALALSEAGVGEITAGALTKTASRERNFLFGPSYFDVQEQVICPQRMIRNGNFPRTLSDLIDVEILVGSETSYVESLKTLQKELPALDFEVVDGFSSEQILAMVADKQNACTVVDSNIFAINNRYYPALRKALNIGETKEIAWILREGEEELSQALSLWLETVEASGDMRRLVEHYYSYTHSFNYLNIATFHKRLKTRLPQYKTIFENAAQKYDIPWTLLAAQSYQESHWDRLAKSPTGVRGMMMLTQITAKEMGVKYRLNAAQSIEGGAKYFKKLYDRIAPDVLGLERYKFAYAAYNVGMGHIYDAQKLAKKLGFNPNIWTDMKKVLPLLSEKKYYRTLKYGYARGSEPVKYVEAIYNYRNILENHIDDNTTSSEINGISKHESKDRNVTKKVTTL